MKKAIVFVDLFQGITWFFNTEKQTFIHPYEANLADPAFWYPLTEIPAYVAEIALDEFQCTESYLHENGLGLQKISF